MPSFLPSGKWRHPFFSTQIYIPPFFKGGYVFSVRSVCIRGLLLLQLDVPVDIIRLLALRAHQDYQERLRLFRFLERHMETAFVATFVADMEMILNLLANRTFRHLSAPSGIVRPVY